MGAPPMVGNFLTCFPEDIEVNVSSARGDDGSRPCTVTSQGPEEGRPVSCVAFYQRASEWGIGSKSEYYPVTPIIRESNLTEST